MTKRFMYWWLVTVIEAILLGITIYFGSLEFLWETDVTKLSFLVIALWIGTSAVIGYTGYRKKTNFDTPWFIAESCMTIGMVGTVVGFMLMLGSSFAEIDPGNIDSMRQVIIDMAAGMSTALLTTLTGLIASLFLKVQVVVYEHEDE
ncbi:MAG: hypothetical protein CBD74_14210 [Saprospirales bacterium TMED214]|nr:MAG: hypothetical protein CBD74_14210 [Saprospirales bacterium TMED214]